MSVSRTSRVLMAQGDPFLGFGFLGKAIGGIARGVGRMFGKGGAKAAISKIAPVVQRASKTTIAKVAGGVAVGAAGTAVGNAIINPSTGQVVGFKRRSRGKGISARELRGFRKVANLLHRVGMTPKGLGRRRGGRCR